MIALYILVLLAVLTNGDLIADRIYNAELRVNAAIDTASLEAAFDSEWTTDDFIQITRELGDFVGKLVAKEYAAIATSFTDLLGYAPVILRPTFDVGTTLWLNTDILLVKYNQNVSTGYNLTTQEYDLNGDGFRNTFYFKFETGTKRIKLAYLIQDAGQVAIFNELQTSFTTLQICRDYIIPACNGSAFTGPLPYLVNTTYTSEADCVAHLNMKPQIGVCPFPARSDTTICRHLHATSAFFLPSTHCPHVPPVSPVCVDTCMPACANCHADAKCVVTFPDLTTFTPVYQCQCNNGYAGNGTYCEPQLCHNNHCDAPKDSFTCASSNGACTCNPTFVHDPLNTGNDYCVCPEDHHTVKNGTELLCIPNGRCLSEQSECDIQNYNEVKCQSPGVNPYVPYNQCVCNYGFIGGHEFPCTCESGRRKLWSPTIDGKVCLSDSECTEDWHCDPQETCDIDVGQIIGTCA